MKIVINAECGGYALSTEAKKFLGINHDGDIERNDPRLVDAVEKLGDKANGFCAELKIVDIPDGVDWIIENYDGKEWVSERHRTWS